MPEAQFSHVQSQPPRRANGWHLAVLACMAISQPLYDLLGGSPEFFVAHGARAREVLAMVAVLGLVVPAFPSLLIRPLRRRFPSAAWRAHLLLLLLLVALIVLPPLGRRLPEGKMLPIVLALMVGALAAVAYRAWAAVRTFFTCLTPALLLLPGLFLFDTPLRKLLSLKGSVQQGPELASTPPVVMVVFDELSLPTLLDEQGDFDRSRFPGLARLADRSHWFRNATTVADGTLYSIPAMLSGRHPGEDRLPTYHFYRRNLFGMLGASYQLHVREGLTDLCPETLCPTRGPGAEVGRLALWGDTRLVLMHALLPPALSGKLPPIDQNWVGFRDAAYLVSPREVAASFEEELRRAAPGNFYFLHLILPHTPWRYLPEGQQYDGEVARIDGVKGGIWGQERWPRVQGLQRYLLQAAFADRVLDEQLQALEQSGQLDSALIVVVADHGLSFLPGEHRRLVQERNLAGLALVPMLIKLPGQQIGEVHDDPAQTIDLLPTMRDVLGVEVQWPMHGRSLLQPAPAVELREIRRSRERLGPVQTFSSRDLDALAVEERTLLRAFEPGLDGLYRPDLRRDLLGLRRGQLQVLSRDEVKIRVQGRKRYRELQPNADPVPALVRGEVTSERLNQGGLTLVVLVDRRVEAVTRTLPADGGRAAFSAMLPPHLLQEGPVHLQVLALDEGAI